MNPVRSVKRIPDLMTWRQSGAKFSFRSQDQVPSDQQLLNLPCSNNATSVVETEPVQFPPGCVNEFNGKVKMCASTWEGQLKWLGAFKKKDKTTVKAELPSNQKDAEARVCKDVQFGFNC